MNAFQAGEWVLLTSQKGRSWLVRVNDEPFSCHLGTIDLGAVAGRQEGDVVETNKGGKLILFRPTLRDYIYKLKRKTQIIYPKDLGTILFYGDIQPGQTVLETGVGSGAMSLALLRVLGPHGRLVSVEKRLEFARLARRNIARFLDRSPENHQVVVAGIESVELRLTAHRVMVDLPEPWNAIGSVSRYLVRGGLLVSLSPNIGQVQLTCKELKDRGFANISTFEIIKRDWKIDQRRARPVDRMVAHTGFITVGKKIAA